MRNKQILFLILAIFALSISKSEAQSIVSDSTVQINELDEYDLIFIDAAKSQYIKFFEKYEI